MLKIARMLGLSKAASKDTKWDSSMGSFWSLSAVDIDGVETSFSKFSGKVVMVINVACKCGYTHDGYKHLTELHKKYRDQGFEVLAFPSNQFLHQEPWDESKIKAWVKDSFGSEFEMFSKIDVNGKGTHPVFKFLKQCFPGEISWNFHGKFLINKDGVPVRRFEKESWKIIEEEIVQLLGNDEKKDNASSPAISKNEEAASKVEVDATAQEATVNNEAAEEEPKQVEEVSAEKVEVSNEAAEEEPKQVEEVSAEKVEVSNEAAEEEPKQTEEVSDEKAEVSNEETTAPVDEEVNLVAETAVEDQSTPAAEDAKDEQQDKEAATSNESASTAAVEESPKAE